MDKVLVAGLDAEQLRVAAEAAASIYDREPEPRFETRRVVSRFWLIGDLVACTRVDTATDTALVSIRGTHEPGNWIFTNIQAFFADFFVVDESLACDSEPLQGGSKKRPIHGKVHQGFIRAFSWLWYGTEPVFRHVELSPQRGSQQLLKYAVLFVVPLLAAIRFLADRTGLGLAAGVGSLITMAFILIESGTFEALFMKRPEAEPKEPDRQPLVKFCEQLNKHRAVIFTGHSLGGAIASLCFAVYRSWCQSDTKRRDNAHLVTFGSARLGDEQFVNCFEEQHRDRTIHFQHPGDPVPQIPPSGFRELWQHRYPIRGPLGFMVSLLFPFWKVYRFLYGVPRPAPWSSLVVHTLNEKPYRRLAIDFHNMKDIYAAFVTSRLQREDADSEHWVEGDAFDNGLKSGPH